MFLFCFVLFCFFWCYLNLVLRSWLEAGQFSFLTRSPNHLCYWAHILWSTIHLPSSSQSLVPDNWRQPTLPQSPLIWSRLAGPELGYLASLIPSLGNHSNSAGPQQFHFLPPPHKVLLCFLQGSVNIIELPRLFLVTFSPSVSQVTVPHPVI